MHHSFLSRLGATLALACCLHASAQAQSDLVIYSDSLQNEFQNWSWATVDLANTTTVHSGGDSIAVTASPWSALALHTGSHPVDTTKYGKLTFWANGGTTGGQILRISGLVNDNAQPAFVVGPLVANTWKQYEVRLLDLSIDNNPNVTAFWFQEGTGNAQPTFYIDDISLTPAGNVTPPPQVNGMSLYDDSFVNGWENWSWAQVNPADSTVVHTGESSLAVDEKANTAVYFHHNAFSTEGYANITFWINGGATGGQSVKLVALLGDTQQTPKIIGPLVANTWQKFVVPLADLGIVNKSDLTAFWFQEATGTDQPRFYLDDVYLENAPPPSVVNVSVNAQAEVRKVDPRIFSVNTAIWDGVLGKATTAELLNEIDIQALRFPGGSSSDLYHWAGNTGNQHTDGSSNFDDFARTALVTGSQVFITANYGTGTPAEAASWVRYSNVTKKYGFKYWEIGNENYGTWEADNNNRPHDPVTYVTRFKQYYTQMKAVDPTIKVGAVVEASEDSDANYTDQTVINPRTGASHNGWTAVLLAAFKAQGFAPDFVVYHRYEQGPGGENDAYLLNASRSWADNSRAIRQMLTDYLGSSGAAVEIDCTENNSVYASPGKQTTSLVNGLYLADSIGNILNTEFNTLFWWDLRNGQEASNNNSASLYGWRRYGDYGIVNYADPSGPADRYPTFYVYKLLTHYARGGETVLQASSDYNGLGVYAIRSGNQTVRLLLINKRRVEALNTKINLSGFTASSVAGVYSYGIPQDEAAHTGSGSADVAMGSLSASGTSITYSIDPYTAAVIDLKGVAQPAPSLTITRSGFTLNRRTNRMVQTVTVKNTGASAVNGPIYLVLDSVSLNTKLANAAGVTTKVIPTDSPYVLVKSTALASGASAVVSLEFTVPTSGGITYTPRTLSQGATP